MTQIDTSRHSPQKQFVLIPKPENRSSPQHDTLHKLLQSLNSFQGYVVRYSSPVALGCEVSSGSVSHCVQHLLWRLPLVSRLGKAY